MIGKMQPSAILILLDNSATSINGDFHPNRLDAQKQAADRLVQYYTRNSAETQIGIGVLASEQCVVIASLTSDLNRIARAISLITKGGRVRLEHGIRCAFLALHHRDQELKELRVIVFVASEHDVTPAAAEKIVATARKESVCMDIIAVGDDVNDLDVLESIVVNLRSRSTFLRAQVNSLILSDIVMGSAIGPGLEAHRRIQVNPEDDPDLALMLRMSMEDAPSGFDDEELRLVLEESRRTDRPVTDDSDDPDLAEAVRMSKEEVIMQQPPPPSPAETKGPKNEGQMIGNPSGVNPEDSSPSKSDNTENAQDKESDAK
jgi:26S proteasome regulatory subunit N10